jgi:hypothetical protein
MVTWDPQVTVKKPMRFSRSPRDSFSSLEILRHLLLQFIKELTLDLDLDTILSTIYGGFPNSWMVYNGKSY